MRSINPDEVRQKLLELPKKQDIVLNAVKRYNERLGKVAEKLQKYQGNERGTIEQGISKLEAEITAEQHNLEVNPTNMAARHTLDSRRSTKILLENILEQIDAGVELEVVLAPLPEHKKITDYQRELTNLRNAGILVDVDNRCEVAKNIRELADYQVALLESSFELPAPFSQRFVKDTKPKREDSIDAFVRHEVKAEVKKRFGLKLDDLMKSRDPKHNRAKQEARKMIRAPKLRSLAEKVVESLPEMERVYILPRNKTKADFEKNRRTPEEFYKNAFDKISRYRNYFTAGFRGFDIHHAKIFLTTNNSMGMKMHLYSAFMKSLESHGFDVKKCEVTELKDARAHAARGVIMSRSGVSEKNKSWVSEIPSYRRMQARAHSMWPNVDCGCDCEDSAYMGVMHRRTEYKPSYFDTHVVSLACDYMKQEQDDGNRVMNPFAFPLHDQIDFEQRFENQVLIVTKRSMYEEVPEGKERRMDVKQANRGEREWLNMMNVSELGYDRTYTTDFKRARTAMFDMNFK